MSQIRSQHNDSKLPRSTSIVSDRSGKPSTTGSKRLQKKKITAYQTYAPHRTNSKMNMDLHAASIGIDLNEIDSFPDAEEAEEPIGYEMRAIQPGKIETADSNTGELLSPATPELVRIDSANQQTLRKQATLKKNDQENSLLKSDEELVSPVPLRAKVSHVDND